MIWQTPIGSRLELALDAEHRRMVNEWFFKWHQIGWDRVVEIDSFDGRMIRYGGIKFDGTARTVYWDTIQRYLRNKVSAIFEELENDLQKYPIEIREQALKEAHVLINGFAGRIRNSAVAKDRILRGNGIDFPPAHDFGQWTGCQPPDVNARVESLRKIYCVPRIAIEGRLMPFADLMKDNVTLVKKDGTIFRKDITAAVTKGKVITFEKDLPLEVGDHFLRELPNGLVDDFVVTDPGYMASLGGEIGPHFQAEVKRGDAPTAAPQTVINYITGHNARVNINSTDNSVNSMVENSNRLFDQLAATLTSQIQNQSERDKLLALVTEMRASTHGETFKEKYQSFIAAAANHITIIAPFLPALAALL